MQIFLIYFATIYVKCSCDIEKKRNFVESCLEENPLCHCLLKVNNRNN